MAEPRMKVAQLDAEALDKVRALEDTLGAYVVALEPDYPLADLSDDELAQLQELERALGVVLLAYGKS